VSVRGRLVTFPTTAALHAIGRLASARPSGVRAQELIEDLWPDTEPKRATHRLDVVLNQIRSAMRPALRLTRSGTLIHLHVDADECDFLQAMDRSTTLLERGSSADPAALAEVHEVLRRPFLGGSYEDWVQDVEARIDHRLLELSSPRGLATAG
jgi:two-component SAPR family response regulator